MVMEEKVEEEARASELESSVGLHPHGKLLSYLGLRFSIFLALLPSSSSISQLSTLHLKLLQAEQELCHLKSGRKEDSKANEIASLRAKVVELERSEAELKARVEKLTREPDKIFPHFSLLISSYFPHYFLRKIIGKILQYFL
ncbi:hypothetical protein PVL29_017342 [Vitis rotundifolia]|uniref:Uncharacterized protein n=1 Tax=Vitis rotundifolia TaxID=103349 RepID=A0AA38ZB01_VITRO|nr:hypothetical protein PVL29_017342 [Vitis rotundifolia]